MAIQAPLDEIEPNPYQTRQSYDQQHIEELAADIERNGLLQKPVGRPVSSDGELVTPASCLKSSGPTLSWRAPEGYALQLAFGHNRFRAFRHLGREKMPVEVKLLSDEEMATLAWTENAQRKDLSPIEEALAIQRRIDEFGWTQKQVAEELGIGRSTVANKLRLLKLPDEVLEHVRNGEISERQALALHKAFQIPDEEIEALKEESYYPTLPADLVERAVERNLSSERLREDAEHVAKRARKSLERIEQRKKSQERLKKKAEAAKEKGEDVEVLKISELSYDAYDRVSDDSDHYNYVEGCSPECECRAEAIDRSGEITPICLDPGRRRYLKGQATREKKKRRREEIQKQLEAFHEHVGSGAEETAWSPAAVRVIALEALRHAYAKDLRAAVEYLELPEILGELKNHEKRGEAERAFLDLTMEKMLRLVLETLIREDLRGYVDNGFDTKECDAVMADEPYETHPVPEPVAA